MTKRNERNSKSQFWATGDVFHVQHLTENLCLHIYERGMNKGVVSRWQGTWSLHENNMTHLIETHHKRFKKITVVQRKSGKFQAQDPYIKITEFLYINKNLEWILIEIIKYLEVHFT